MFVEWLDISGLMHHGLVSVIQLVLYTLSTGKHNDNHDVDDIFLCVFSKAQFRILKADYMQDRK